MIELKIDETEVKKLYTEKLEEHISKIETEALFWDTKELERQTKMCYNTMQKTFFYDPDFPKRKIGNKFYYPAKKTKEFLLDWIEKQ